MPQEQGYQRRVATPGPQRAVLADADAYGAGIGRAIEQGGEQLHRSQLRAYQAERRLQADSEAADVARRSAEARLSIDEFVRTSRTGPTPGAKGHGEAVRKTLEDQRAALLNGIREDSIRNNAAAAWDDYAARVTGREEEYELGRGVALDVSNIERAGELAENRVVSGGGDAEIYREELTQGYAAIDALENVTPEEKEKLKRARETGLTAAWLRARMATDPATVRMELASGAYDKLLTPEQVERLDRGAELEIKAKVVEAEAAASEARTAARNGLEAIEARVEAGDIPAAKEVQAAISAARAAGVPEADMIRLTTKVDDATILRAYNPANDPTGARSAAAVDAIDAKIRAGTATPEEYRLREQLDKYGDTRATDTAAKLKELAATGPAGQLQAVRQIAAMPSRAERFEAGRKLGGNLGYVALLPSAAAQSVAINGAGVLKARPKDFGEKADVQLAFERTVGPIAPALGAGYGELQTLAWQIYAGQMNDKGRTGWDKRAFDLAVKVAFGATARRDGTLQGGIGTVRGRQVVLPDDFTPGEFDAVLSRMTFKDAVYADGSAANKVDVLSRFRPEWYDSDASGANYYRLIGPGGKPLRMKDGQIYPLRISRQKAAR